jgi:hypothetical protein
MDEDEVQDTSPNQDSINRLKMMLGQDASPTKPQGSNKTKSPHRRSPERFTNDEAAPVEASASPSSSINITTMSSSETKLSQGAAHGDGPSVDKSGKATSVVDVFDFSSFPTEPIPLILPEVDANGREELVVQEEALALLRRIAVPVAVLAVSGLYRSGKSSLLNWLCDPTINSDLFEKTTLAAAPTATNINSGDNKDKSGGSGGGSGFAVGATVMRCTRGIWLWGRPRLVTMEDGSKGALIVMDTEGLGGMDAGAAYDARVFSLSALLCSTMLYNSLGTIDEKAISSLSFVADLARNIRLTPKEGQGRDSTTTNKANRKTSESSSSSASGGDSDEVSNKSSDKKKSGGGGAKDQDLSDLGHLFPSFVWVLIHRLMISVWNVYIYVFDSLFLLTFFLSLSL